MKYFVSVLSHYIYYPTTRVLTLLSFFIQGTALVFAPLRGETLRLFCQLAQQAGLCASQHQQYDAQVWDVHMKVRSMSKKWKIQIVSMNPFKKTTTFESGVMLSKSAGKVLLGLVI